MGPPGILYVVLLFGTGEWRRLIPTSWDIFPQAWDVLIGYLSFKMPQATAYNRLQQISYAAVVFLLSPLLILTGTAMSPAIAARFPGTRNSLEVPSEHAACTSSA
ncbi:MAG TPA: cytochrome b/b6 domain-containing protein [Thermomicrobiales bacterium]|nr:cytochrome b/b6 domain-containing protein [Thermomicrobiales bacterium]